MSIDNKCPKEKCVDDSAWGNPHSPAPLRFRHHTNYWYHFKSNSSIIWSTFPQYRSTIALSKPFTSYPRLTHSLPANVYPNSSMPPDRCREPVVSVWSWMAGKAPCLYIPSRFPRRDKPINAAEGVRSAVSAAGTGRGGGGGTNVPRSLSSSSLAQRRARCPLSSAIKRLRDTIIRFLAAWVHCSFATRARCQNTEDKSIDRGINVGRITLK